MSRDLDIRLLRAFEAVVRVGGVSRAAAVLNRSQPVVSQQIRKLESLVGHALFACERSWKTTRQGELLLASAQRIIALNDELFSDLGDSAAAAPLRIGVPEEFALAHLSAALDKFKSAWPRVPIDIEVNLSRNLLQHLHEGSLDLILAKQPQIRPGESDAVWSENLVWVAGEHFSTEPDGAIPLVVFNDACLYRRSAINTLSKADRRWRIAATCSSWTGIKAAVHAGVGVTVASTHFPMNGLREIANDEGYPTLPHVSVILMRGPGSHTAAGDYLAGVLRETARRGYGSGIETPVGPGGSSPEPAPTVN